MSQQQDFISKFVSNGCIPGTVIVSEDPREQGIRISGDSVFGQKYHQKGFSRSYNIATTSFRIIT